MRSKTIKAVISRKIHEWTETIEDKNVRALARRDAIITGGCITSMLLNEDVNDFDVYFKSMNTAYVVANYYADKFNRENGSDCVQVLTSASDITEDMVNEIVGTIEGDRVYIYIPSSGIASEEGIVMGDVAESVLDIPLSPETIANKEAYRPLFFSSNAITLSDKIQLVMRFNGDIDTIHDTYDFVHTKCHFDNESGELTLPPESLECILSKQLIYSGSKYPLCSVIRTRKFIERGWHITAGEYIKMLYQTSKLDLDDINVLADQLVGVDSAYFTSLLMQLKKSKRDDIDFTYGDAYLCTIVDAVFNGKVKYA